MWWWDLAAAASVSAPLLVCTHTFKSPRTHTRSCVQLFLPDSYKYEGCLRTLVGRSVYVSNRLGLLFQHYKAPKHKSVTAGTTGREIHALSHDLEGSPCPNLLLFFLKTLKNYPYRSQPGTSVLVQVQIRCSSARSSIPSVSVHETVNCVSAADSDRQVNKLSISFKASAPCLHPSWPPWVSFPLLTGASVFLVLWQSLYGWRKPAKCLTQQNPANIRTMTSL